MSSEPEVIATSALPARRLTVIMPVYNDWQSATLLTRDIGIAMSGGGYVVGIVAVDDGSTEPPPSVPRSTTSCPRSRRNAASSPLSSKAA